MKQKIKHISIRDLVLWTENPRDPIRRRPGMTDQKMANRAISEDGRSKWSLNKLFKAMGKRYDFSELPTVVHKDGEYIVYDGNRRMLIGKIVHGLVKVKDIGVDFSKLDFPESVPCNVCDERVALENTYRKHTGTGSWGMIEREIFKHKHMKEDKSTILIFEDATGYISKSEKMNQGFVKKEVLTLNNLEKLGFPIIEGELQSQYEKDEDAIAVLDAVAGHIEREEITTRTSRGDIIRLLDKALLRRKAKGEPKPFGIPKGRKSSRPKSKPSPEVEQYQLFGDGGLALGEGVVKSLCNDLYELYKIKDQKRWSKHYQDIIHSGFRLALEVAAFEQLKSKEKNDTKRLRMYIKKNFEDATKNLSDEEKIILRRDVYTNAKGKEQRTNRLIDLVNDAAHGHKRITRDQGIAVSLILGKILEISHGEE